MIYDEGGGGFLDRPVRQVFAKLALAALILLFAAGIAARQAYVWRECYWKAVTFLIVNLSKVPAEDKKQLDAIVAAVKSARPYVADDGSLVINVIKDGDGTWRAE